MPPRRKQTTSEAPFFKGEFSFVNKDASNISSKDHNAHVSWHVVNRYERWKKQEHTKKLRESVNLPAHSGHSSSGRLDTPVRKTRDHRSNRSLTNVWQIDNNTALLSYPVSSWTIDNVEQSLFTSSGSTANLPRYQTDNIPFSNSGPSYIADMHEGNRVANEISDATAQMNFAQYPPLIAKILDYTSSFVIPSLWPKDPAGSKWAYEISRTMNELAMINADTCYASATLCFYATVMASITGDTDVASQACFFQTQAMEELRTRISPQSGGHDTLTLKAILRLFSAETALDNTSTARVHLKMLRNIITAEGGVILLDSWFRENLLSADCYFALKYETRPLFPAGEWTPGLLAQSWKTRLASVRLTGDHAPEVNTAVDGVLRTVITDLRELFRVQRFVDSHGVSPDDQLLRWRQLRKLDCLSRLADHQLNVKIYPHLFVRPKLQLAICAAIALLCAMVMGSPEPVRFGTKLVRDLHTKLVDARKEQEQESIDPSEHEHPNTENTLFWITHVGMMGEYTHPFEPEALWFAGEFGRVSVALNILSLEDQHAIAKQFLCSQSLLNDIEQQLVKRCSNPIKGVYESCGTSWEEPTESVKAT